MIHSGCTLVCHSYPETALVPCLQSQSYTNYFADALVAEAKKDARIVGIHAAMGGGTGMNRFEKASPCRAAGLSPPLQLIPPLQSPSKTMFAQLDTLLPPTCVCAGVPRARVRRGHRRAARGHICSRPCLRGAGAVCGHLLLLPAARLRPGGA